MMGRESAGVTQPGKMSTRSSNYSSPGSQNTQGQNSTWQQKATVGRMPRTLQLSFTGRTRSSKSFLYPDWQRSTWPPSFWQTGGPTRSSSGLLSLIGYARGLMRCSSPRVANAGTSNGMFPIVVDSPKLVTSSTAESLAQLPRLTARMPSRARPRVRFTTSLCNSRNTDIPSRAETKSV